MRKPRTLDDVLLQAGGQLVSSNSIPFVELAGAWLGIKHDTLHFRAMHNSWIER